MLSTKTRVLTDTDAGAAVREGASAYQMDMATTGFDTSQEIVSDEATDTGQLLQSGIPPEPQRDGSVIWGYAADYAEPVNDGSEPHWAPIEPLRGWARRVLGNEQAAYAVQAHIAEEGTDPVRFIERSVKRMRDWASARDLSDYVTERL